MGCSIAPGSTCGSSSAYEVAYGHCRPCAPCVPPPCAEQALIAGGTFNGDLYIWDLSLEGDAQRGRSDALCDLRHQEPILSIVWQYSLTEAGKYGTRCVHRSSGSRLAQTACAQALGAIINQPCTAIDGGKMDA